MTLKEAVILGVRFLQHKVANPNLEARIILRALLNITDLDFVIRSDSIILNLYQRIIFKRQIKLRATGFPLGYITKTQDFWEDTFYINKNVLIPRNDSETIISAVLEEFKDKNQDLEVLDLGVGSGCLLLSLLREYPKASGVGVDISRTALRVAKKNAKLLGLISRAIFFKSNIFSRVKGKFDLIISNPPYISNDDEYLEDNVKKYEPNLALFAKNEGLFFYEEIFVSARKYLKNGGKVIVEVGHKQQEFVSAIALKNGFKYVGGFKDAGNIERALIFK